MTEIPQKPAEAPEGAPERENPATATPLPNQLRPRVLEMLEKKRRPPGAYHPRRGARGPYRKGERPSGGSPVGVPAVKLQPAPTPVMARSLKDALDITDQEVVAYIPTVGDIKVGEALVSGLSTVLGIQGYTGLTTAEIKQTMNNPVAMAYISRQVEALFKTRASVIDAAVYLRAAAGDIAAAKLFYDRMKLLTSQNVRVDHVYSGGLNISALPDDELARIVLEKGRMLPKEFQKIIDVPASNVLPKVSSDQT